MAQTMLYIILGFILGAGAAYAFLQRRRGALDTHMEDRFRLTAQEAVQKAHESFLHLAEARLKEAHKDSAYDLDKRQKAIDELIKPVHENLKSLSGAIEQVKGTDTALREDMKTLSKETARLVGALRDPAGQGQWGEFILEGLLDKSGLIKGVHYETQITMKTQDGVRRPDAVIRMQDGFSIVVDSKAPLNEFVQRLSEDLSEEDHQALMKNLARQVREHVKALSRKGYWENLESPDFTVLFLPSEHMYSLSLRADPSLVDFAAAGNVIIASPTLLMSLIRVVGMSWRQADLAKNAAEISERGSELYKRLLAFTDKIDKIGRGLQGAMKTYDEAVGSLERSVLPAARKFRDLQGTQGTADIPELLGVEETPRLLNLSAEDEKEKKRA